MLVIEDDRRGFKMVSLPPAGWVMYSPGDFPHGEFFLVGPDSVEEFEIETWLRAHDPSRPEGVRPTERDQFLRDVFYTVDFGRWMLSRRGPASVAPPAK